MTNQKPQTIRHIGPASTTAVLSPTRACLSQAENGSAITSGSRITKPSSVALLAKEDHASLVEPSTALDPASGHQPSTNNHPPTAPRKVGRNGKIARLAKPLRDMVNLMLQNNIPHVDIADAIEEHGIRVTVRNISNWKTRGGYDDWRLEQQHIVTKRLRQDNLTDYLRANDATHLPEVGLQLAATQLSEFFLKPETEQQLAATPEKFARTISNLCRVTRHLHLLQKYRDDSARELGYKHNPERLKRETDKKLETTRHIFSAERLGDTDDEPDLPHRNFIPKNQFADESDPAPAHPPVNPIRDLSSLVSLLKHDGSHKPANPAKS